MNLHYEELHVVVMRPKKRPVHVLMDACLKKHKQISYEAKDWSLVKIYKFFYLLNNYLQMKFFQVLVCA